MLKTKNTMKRQFMAMMVLAAMTAVLAAGPAWAKKKKVTYQVTLAHAKNDERGRASYDSYGAKPGDQKGNEVAMDSYFSYSGWTYVARPKNAAAAKAIAKQAINGCKNNKIGYGKDGLQLYDAAEEVGFKLKNIKKKCHTDCFQFVATCCAAAGLHTDPIYAGREEDYKEEEDFDNPYTEFIIFRDKAHRRTASLLKVGDILVREGRNHAAIVCKIKKK